MSMNTWNMLKAYKSHGYRKEWKYQIELDSKIIEVINFFNEENFINEKRKDIEKILSHIYILFLDEYIEKKENLIEYGVYEIIEGETKYQTNMVIKTNYKFKLNKFINDYLRDLKNIKNFKNNLKVNIIEVESTLEKEKFVKGLTLTKVNFLIYEIDNSEEINNLDDIFEEESVETELEEVKKEEKKPEIVIPKCMEDMDKAKEDDDCIINLFPVSYLMNFYLKKIKITKSEFCWYEYDDRYCFNFNVNPSINEIKRRIGIINNRVFKELSKFNVAYDDNDCSINLKEYKQNYDGDDCSAKCVYLSGCRNDVEYKINENVLYSKLYKDTLLGNGKKEERFSRWELLNYFRILMVLEFKKDEYEGIFVPEEVREVLNYELENGLINIIIQEKILDMEKLEEGIVNKLYIQQIKEEYEDKFLGKNVWSRESIENNEIILSIKEKYIKNIYRIINNRKQRTYRKTRSNKEYREKCKQLKEQGLNYSEIAKEVGRTPQAISQLFKRIKI